MCIPSDNAHISEICAYSYGRWCRPGNIWATFTRHAFVMKLYACFLARNVVQSVFSNILMLHNCMQFNQKSFRTIHHHWLNLMLFKTCDFFGFVEHKRRYLYYG